MNSTGLRILGAKSTLGNLSPGNVHPLSSTILYTDRKGACRMSPPTASPSSAVRAARKHDGPEPRDRPYRMMEEGGICSTDVK
jgi:hypothetical protein